MCAFCNEEGIVKTCTRKNDLKRHIEDFHNTNAQWHCRHRGCELVFDWQTAYKAHLKQAHGGSRMSLDEAKVNLCPQVVFACGFDNCLQVFEAHRDSEAQHVFKEYVSHVVKHFDDGAQSGQWTYSSRIRNLLRQLQVSRAVLRKRLETRHIGDICLLINYAICLGRDPSQAGKFREDFVTPFRDTCTEAGLGHNTLKRPMSQESEDTFNFRISRGSNPVLAQYINAQRRLYVPRQQGGSRRPRQSIPTSTPTSNPMNTPSLGGPLNSHLGDQLGAGNTYYATSMSEGSPGSPSYDGSAAASHSFNSPNGMMHQSPHGRMMPDDLRSLRSMARFSTPYAASMHSPCTPDSMGGSAGLEPNQGQGFFHPHDHHHHPSAVRHPHAY
ncbi:unnamed protein product [Parascedosporium putredinis]|uniref:C2H2-type domain-containing protein n=1 Tax=Parascedosporium putredinis TaxID=1442378 RepID=A0A9P1GX10_9PEZI|nr:unnamed protein product [Parascedosporium putredinis]CAI7989359.1 unnamed protein product [Parascedosporium putredinis]